MDNNNIIITIGRQIGSGGSAIAKMLAEEFGARLYDKEILNLAARESGFCEEFFEENDMASHWKRYRFSWLKSVL